MSEIIDQFGYYWTSLTPLFTFLGIGGLSIGAIVLAAYGLFRWLGEKWIESKFERNLEAYKTEQARELEKLRMKINAILDRAMKLHVREFEVVPEVWGRCFDAYIATLRFVSPLQRTVSLDFMSNSELEEFLASSAILDSQKQQVRNATDKTRSYYKITYPHRFSEVGETAEAFREYLRRNSIFVEPALRSKFDQMFDYIAAALSEHRLMTENEILPRGRTAEEKLEKEGKQLLAELEASVQTRLWSATAEIA